MISIPFSNKLIFERGFFMFKIQKQLYFLLTITVFSSFQIAGASWVALLAARGFSLVEIGLAESCFHTASLLFEVPSGVISDVFGRKRSMILSQCMFVLSALLMAFSTSLPEVCISLVLDALGYNFASGTREALAYDSLKASGQEEKYVEFSSWEFSLYRISNAAAILCAGFALLIGYKKAYLLDALLGTICLFFCFRLKEVTLLPESSGLPADNSEHPLARILQCFRESISFITRNPRTIALMLWNALIGSLAILPVFFLQARLTACGLPDSLLGPGLFLVSMGGAIGARLAVKVTNWIYWHLSALCAAGVLTGILCELNSLPLLMCMGGFLLNLSDDLLEVKTDAVLNDRFPSSQRATLISVSSLCFSVVMILLSPVAGYLFS